MRNLFICYNYNFTVIIPFHYSLFIYFTYRLTYRTFIHIYLLLYSIQLIIIF